MEQIKLEEFNHWWITNKVDEDLALQFKRDIYNIIEKRIENKFIIALTSLRRVGKTTILYQLIQNLIEKKLNLLIYFSSLLMIIVQK